MATKPHARTLTHGVELPVWRFLPSQFGDSTATVGVGMIDFRIGHVESACWALE